MWELDHKEGWAPKNWCFWTVVLEKTFESPLVSKAIKPVNPKGNWPWIFIGRTDVEAEAPILWSPDTKNWLFRKDPDAGKNWRQEEKGMTEGEMVGWHHWVNGCEFEQAPGDGKGQGSLRAVVHGVAKSQTRLSDRTTTTILRAYCLFVWVSEASGMERGVWKDADILGVIYWPGKTGREKCVANDAQVFWFEEPGGTQVVKFRYLWDIRTHCSVAKLCLMLCDPMDCSPPDSSPWNIPGKNTKVGCHFLLQGIFPTMGLDPCALHWQVDSLPLSHLGMTDCIRGTPSLCPISLPSACDFLTPPIKWQNIFLAPWFPV